MLRDRPSVDISEFLRYLASHPEAENGLPSLNKLSEDLGISLAALREQLEVARALGLVEVRPRTGTRRLPFSFIFCRLPPSGLQLSHATGQLLFLFPQIDSNIGLHNPAKFSGGK